MSKVNFGIQDVHAAILTETDGEITYGTPFEIEGAVSLSIDPEGGDSTPFYADNVIYFRSPEVNNGYTGTLELAVTPEAFLTQILGQDKDGDGVIYETADDTKARFALLFQSQGDTNNRRFCFYDCIATRPSRTNETKEDTITPGTDSIEITMNPRITDRMVKCYIDETEENKAIYDAWFTTVHEKTGSV